MRWRRFGVGIKPKFPSFFFFPFPLSSSVRKGGRCVFSVWSYESSEQKCILHYLLILAMSHMICGGGAVLGWRFLLPVLLPAFPRVFCCLQRVFGSVFISSSACGRIFIPLLDSGHIFSLSILLSWVNGVVFSSFSHILVPLSPSRCPSPPLGR